MKTNAKQIAILVIFASLLLGSMPAMAADFKPDDQKCAETALDAYCKTVEQKICQDALQKCLKMYEDRAKIFDATVQESKQKSKTLSGEISYIQSKIKGLDNEISHNTVIIKDLGVQVKSTEESITDTEKKIDSARERLKNLMVIIFKEDQKSAIEEIFSGKDLTESVDNFIAFKSLSYRNQALLRNVEDLRSYLDTQKEKLVNQKDNLEDATAKKEAQKNQNLSLKEQKNEVLQATKGEEKLFTQYKQAAEAKAAAIRSRIFNLAGISGVSKAPSFGEALEIAQRVGQRVGVRGSFILGILAQETSIGKNVGKCYIVGATGLGANGKPVMRPSQADLFVQITQEAGLDYKTVPVSCPIPSKGCTYGGAMGPAQFMPSTWNLFKDQIASMVGHKPNPWNIEDSVYAAALFVKDAGATADGKGELKAAARYFGSGSYGYQQAVQVKATCIETFIKEGTMSARCESLVF